MNIKDLQKKFEIAKDIGEDILIELTVPNSETSEFIVVQNDNLDTKLNYYLESYNENLELKRFTEIKIIGIEVIVWDKNLFA